MAGKIIINAERCKGCGLCVKVCPKGHIAISKESNKAGFFPAQVTDTDCTGCSVCALVCPDAVIEVLREQVKIRDTIGSKKKIRPENIEVKK